MPASEELSHSIIPMLHWQSGLFGRGTQNLVLRNQLGSALAKLDREVQVVGDIQRSLLPQELPRIAGFEVAARYEASARAGGDYYDFFPLTGDSIGMFIADVSGHGTPAAVLMAITHAIAHSKPDVHTPPAAMLAYLNRQLTRSYTSGGTLVTSFYAVLDPATRTLKYSGAGHNPPRLVRRGTVTSLDAARSMPLGIDADERYSEVTVQLERGDVLLLYTDGITEAMGPASVDRSPDLFGTDRLDSALLGSESSVHRIVEEVWQRVQAFTNSAPATDDRTVIAIRCL